MKLTATLLAAALLAWTPRAAAKGADSRSRRPSKQSGDECLAEPVTVVRAYTHPPEKAKVSLTHCDGSPHEEALAELSILARPDGVERPSRRQRRRFRRTATAAKRARFVARHIMRLHAGLLTRLQAILDRWPDNRVEVVSGYRPDARDTSRHHHGRALDFRLSDVHRRRVSKFARKLERTGVGFYPNSVFTHVDVRNQSAYWVDRSAPGEPADYGPWPPNEDEQRALRDEVLADAKHALEALQREGGHEPEASDSVQAASEDPKVTRADAGDRKDDAASSQRTESERAAGPAGSETVRKAARSVGRHGSDVGGSSDPSEQGEADDEDSHEGIGGLRSAEGVIAAWSSVPHESDGDDAPAPEPSPENTTADDGNGDDAPASGGKRTKTAPTGTDKEPVRRPTPEEVRQVRDDALRALDRLAKE